MEQDETLESGNPPSAPAAAPGTRIGKYELLRQLGAGGMGVVWAARDPDLDREIAIKVLRGVDATPMQRTRLLREARAMARLKHANVLTVYEVDSDGGRDFIVMELIDGGNLDTWLQSKPPRREIWDALFAAGRGLAAAHDAGLVHRDFKPHNVLRSRDGRVLVTDFGLARGQVEDLGIANTLEPGTSAGDSVLDLRLTVTGQLIGTPAYMAPEQFAGEPPDPRSDQFAFCVTAWEALSNGRPYKGSTLEELRRETAEHDLVPGALPTGVRGVLARGLSPDRAKRWPDMRALLAALERARHAGRRRALLAIPVLAAAAIAGGFALRGHHAAPGTGCQPGDQAFASAWSSEVHAEVLHKQPAAAELAHVLDGARDRWIAGYAKACTERRPAAIDCYLRNRDDVAVFVEVLQRFPPDTLGRLDTRTSLSGGDACAADAPIASPRFPDDDRRPKVIAYLAKLYGNVVSAPMNVLADEDQLRAEAKAIGWAPLEASLEQVVGASAEMSGQLGIAARSYRKAADLARASRDYPAEARARLGVLEVGMYNIVDDMPRNAYDEQLREAELAIKNAGNDPGLVAALDIDRAIHAAQVADELSRAIQILDGAYATLTKLGDRTRGPKAAALLAGYLSVRALPGDLERAATLVHDARQTVEKGPLTGVRLAWELVDTERWLAWLRGDLAAAHAALDAYGTRAGNGRVHITGHVRNVIGVPVPGAHVVVWHGELFGDAARAFTDPRTEVRTATTDASGAFTLEVLEGDAVIAELDDRRSAPAAARDGVQLALGPTHSVTGTIDAGGDPAIGIDPFVRFEVTPTSSWVVSTASSADGRFTIAGLPATTAGRLGAIGTHWPRETGRRIDAGDAVDQAVIHWPVGETTDVQVRAKSGEVWVFRAAIRAKTRIEVEKLAATAKDVAMVQLAPVGWANMTFAGLDNYQPGDLHAVVRDNGPGDQTICVDVDDSPNVECRTYQVDATPGIVRDGRHWFGSSSTLFAPR